MEAVSPEKATHPRSPSAQSGPASPKRLCPSVPTPAPQVVTDAEPLKPSVPKPEKLSKRKLKSNRQKKKELPLNPSDQSLEFSVKDLLGEEVYQKVLEAPGNWEGCGWELNSNVDLEVEISDMSSFGDGIAVSPNKNWAILIPFCVPGDIVKVRVYRHSSTFSFGDLISVVKPGEWRNDSLVRCKYFGKCSGCQYQMIDYDKQLDLKRIVVEKAFKHFSGLDPSLIPAIEPTLPSPQRYEYRTKLTPHFELPRQLKNKKAAPLFPTGDYSGGPGGLAIGLAEKGRRRVVDIEECPLGTRTINEKLASERARVQSTIHTFKRGATLLLRESLVLPSPNSADQAPERIDDETRICITDHKAMIREKVLDKYFEQNAGSFFQNNPSILGSFMNYVIELLPQSDGDRYLVDAYCGSGLFSISLAQYFTQTTGIELAADSLHYAQHNAKLNKIDNASFIVGEAEAIFKDLTFPAAQTTIIIDPPRKGCSSEFINQLLDYKPMRIIYISCNVHTQARDIGKLTTYQVDRIRGADFFPQTHHCESIALLTLAKP